MTVRALLDHSVPIAPHSGAEAAWVTARLTQVLDLLGPRANTVTEAWVELHPDTRSRVVATLCREDETETVFTHGGHDIAVVFVDDEHADETSFTLSLSSDDPVVALGANGVNGFCYPHPLPAETIHTRWVLQHLDGIDAPTAAVLAERL